MGNFGGYYKGEKKKLKKKILERKAIKITKIQVVPRVEILGKKGK